MAPNGTAGRKTPAAPPKAKGNGGVPLAGLFDDLIDEKLPALIDSVKKSLFTTKKPGSWDPEIPHDNKAKKGTGQPPVTINKVPASVAQAFPTSRPMQDKFDILKCTHCKRAVNNHAMPKHIEGCLNKKQEKQRKKKEAKDARDAAARKERGGADSDEEDDEGGAKKTTANKSSGLGASKKRKAGEEGDEVAPVKKKKKKEESKAKQPKPKAPVDVERQCGVELANGGQCARSLTCKSHSMGAKRAVPGRSAKYDKLLMEYQRKNQARLQKAQFDANAPNPDDENLPSGPVDSDEEKDAVMSAIGRFWGGQSLCQRSEMPLRSKYQHNRIKGMLQSTLGSKGGGLFGCGGGCGFFGSPPAPLVDEQGTVHARKASVAPGARSMMAPAPSRKTSVQAS